MLKKTADLVALGSPYGDNQIMFLASPDALEVILSLSESVSVSIDSTDVTLVSDDTY